MTAMALRMIRAWVLVLALFVVVALVNDAYAACVLCRCIYATDPYGWPIRTSSSFPARGSPECLAKCVETRSNCVFPGVCYPVTSRRIYEVLGGLPEIQCPNPPPYAAPFGGRRGGYSIPY